MVDMTAEYVAGSGSYSGSRCRLAMQCRSAKGGAGAFSKLDEG